MVILIDNKLYEKSESFFFEGLVSPGFTELV
jgi:hypothetical protein